MNVSFGTSDKPCISCLGTEFIQFYQTEQHISIANSESLTFRQSLECCYSCGLIRQEDNETYSDVNLNKYYSHAFRTPANPATLGSGDKRFRNADKRLAFLKKLKSAGTVLEVGYGDGIFLSRAAETFSCTGLDPSEGYSDLNNYLIEKGIELITKPLHEYDSTKKFDVVCAFLVLEHIKDPLAFVRQMMKHLNPDGILIIEVPDIRNYASYNTSSLLTHEHVYHYCVESLAALLSTLGLSLVAADNKDISYGFSLIAAFKMGSKAQPVDSLDGFSAMRIVEGFFKKRVSYRENMTRALERIIQTAQEEGQKIGLYGTGSLFDYAVEFCGFTLQNVAFLFDDTGAKNGKLIQGKDIKPLADIQQYKPDILLVFTESFFDVMEGNVLKQVPDKELNIINIHQLSTNYT